MQLGLAFEELINKASSRMYIMRVYKHYGLPVKQSDLLFNSLIMSIFTYGIALWGCAYYSKYLNQDLNDYYGTVNSGRE